MAESIAKRVNAAKMGPQTERELRALLASVQSDLASLGTQFNQLLTDYNAHVHGGITAGSADSSAVADSTAAAITLNTTA